MNKRYYDHGGDIYGALDCVETMHFLFKCYFNLLRLEKKLISIIHPASRFKFRNILSSWILAEESYEHVCFCCKNVVTVWHSKTVKWSTNFFFSWPMISGMYVTRWGSFVRSRWITTIHWHLSLYTCWVLSAPKHSINQVKKFSFHVLLQLKQLHTT